jgi:hypothetical protein
MVTPEEKEMLFKLWNQLGVDIKSAKYLGIDLRNADIVKLLVAEFYGLRKNGMTDTLIALEQELKDSLNEFFSLPENSPCGGTLRMIGNDVLATRSIFSGFKNTVPLKGVFAYSVPEDFVCEDLETYSDIEDIYRVDECFTDDCLRPVLNETKKFILKRYGFILNHFDMYNEDNVIGDIPIQKYK